LTTDYPQESAKVEWDLQVGDEELQIDPQLLIPAFIELFANAFRLGPAGGALSVTARTEKGRFVFTLREPKQNFERSTENWGREPLEHVTQGHYGLGLHRTRGIIEAHRGQMEARHDKEMSSLITTVTLPAAPAEP
jgi:K+-sensing histidine kinase KdpD